MSDKQPSLLPERNPVTQNAHRREVLRQITIPLVIGILVTLAFAVLASLAPASQASLWADISLIWLIIPMLLLAFILTLLVGGIAYGIIWLVQKLPVFALRVQDLFATIGALVRKISDAIVEPILRAQSFSASSRAFRRSLRTQVKEVTGRRR
jgi:hypothetical protein